MIRLGTEVILQRGTASHGAEILVEHRVLVFGKIGLKSGGWISATSSSSSPYMISWIERPACCLLRPCLRHDWQLIARPGQRERVSCIPATAGKQGNTRLLRWASR